MSGGSWDYAYLKVQEVADELQHAGKTPLRCALGQRLRLFVKALHDIEWVDSGDMGPGDENAAIRAALGGAAAKLEFDEIAKEAERIKQQVDDALERYDTANHDQH